ncbi:putative bifunctional diguanylate cyclase/phosphodiesterase [Labrys monachus]|uniref:Diguanylate cyclase (GGDEF)-like protein n=1 Tax=Labrys monachus TaxID=217067 RepID=A0ABU0FIY2_9HYPH|nr:bifunctional diguanylate cyclase/phosphodiesterase [Labrys monachus]MDQ0394292.1 diguanylate cyclase (GGDEF)-like protein [Labrys monachus]
MMTVLGCIVYRHDLWLVAVAAMLCIAGSWVAARLFHRAATTSGLQRIGWHFLTALAAGAAIWCTHFVAMLGFEASVPVGFDPVLTIVSLLIAVLGSTVGFVIAGSRLARGTAAVGGAIVGLAIVAMHYTGMMAYRVQGIVSWDRPYLVASVILAVGFAAAALHIAMHRNGRADNLMASLLAAAILSLHFTGMAAFRVQPLLIDASFVNPQAFQALALAVAGMALLIVGAGLASYLIDGSLRAESIERLRKMAMNDSLTGLPNRVNFNGRLDQEIDQACHAGRKLALVGIDLNRFKEINDLRGHHAGDEVLRIVARRISGVLRDGEFIARVGGDEFAALHRMADPGNLAGFLARLEEALFKPVRVDDYEVIPGASFGVAIYPDDAADKATLINNADLAMYRAKSDLWRTACFYEPSMDETVRARRNLAADLREALAHHQLSIHYQVQTSVSTGQILGYEALLRWNHPQRGCITPTEFIPLAEENGLILQMGEWVLRSACATAASWEPPYKVAVNLSAVQLAHADLPLLVRQVLEETGLPPHRLELELTETTIFADKERSLHMLRQIKALGVSISLDDFGTGYSSLDTLRSFAFDKIKIDRSFISEAASNPQTAAIIRAILALGKSLGVAVLAEGIETSDQLQMLNLEGCDEGQGFLLGRPAPLSEILDSGQITLKGRSDGPGTTRKVDFGTMGRAAV